MVALPSFLVCDKDKEKSTVLSLYLIKWFPSCKRTMKNIPIFKISNEALIIVYSQPRILSFTHPPTQ